MYYCAEFPRSDTLGHRFVYPFPPPPELPPRVFRAVLPQFEWVSPDSPIHVMHTALLRHVQLHSYLPKLKPSP